MGTREGNTSAARRTAPARRHAITLTRTITPTTLAGICTVTRDSLPSSLSGWTPGVGVGGARFRSEKAQAGASLPPDSMNSWPVCGQIHLFPSPGVSRLPEGPAQPIARAGAPTTIA